MSDISPADYVRQNLDQIIQRGIAADAEVRSAKEALRDAERHAGALTSEAERLHAALLVLIPSTEKDFLTYKRAIQSASKR